MATTLDELIVKIKADIGQYEKELKTASRKAKTESKKISSALSKISGPLKKITSMFGGMGTAIAAAAGATGLGLIVKKSLESSDALAKLSRNLGINAEFLQEMQFMASQTGVKQEDLNMSLMRFNTRVGDAASGNQEYLKSFTEMGISLKDANGNIKNTEILFKEASNAIAALPDAASQAKFAMDLFGLSGMKMINMLSGGSAEIEKFQAQARKLGIVIDADMLKRAEEVNDQFDVFKRVVGTEMTTAVLELAPTLLELAKTFTSVAIAAKPFVVNMTEGVKAIANFALGIETNRDKLVAVTKEYNQVTERIKNIEVSLKSTSAATRLSAKDYGILSQRLVELKTKQQELMEQNQALLDQESKSAESKGSINRQLDEQIQKFKQLQEANKEDLEVKQMTAEEEIALYQEKNNLLKEIDADYYASLIAENEKAIGAIVAKEKQGSMIRLKLAADDAKKERELKAKQNQHMMGAISALASFQNAKSKELAAVGKAAAIASATIKTYEAANMALASLPPPWGAIAAAANIAAGLANVASIVGTPLKTGIDEVPGVGRADNFPAMLQPGERVVPRETNLDLKKFLSQQQPSVPQNITVSLELKGDLAELIDVRLEERGVMSIREAG